MKQRIKKIFICCLALICFFPMSLNAKENDGIIKIIYEANDKLIENAMFYLYKVADYSENIELTLSNDFKDYSIDLNNEWNDIASTLESFILKDDIQELQKEKTNQEGVLEFDSLDRGLYLIKGEKVTIDGITYIPSSILVMIPSFEDGKPVHQVIIHPKYEKYPEVAGSDENLDLKVLKVWEDEGHESIRPDMIEVILLKDGKIAEIVELSSINNWRYTWRNLSDRFTWQVAEKTDMNNYVVSIHKEGITFVITNTFKEELPDDPNELDVPDTPNVSQEPSLPGTGMLWWPVPILASSGMALCLFGWTKLRKQDDEYED